jgi:hypothetical protein
MTRKINSDLRYLTQWLLANKISLNTGKTELIIFKNPNKKIPDNIKIKMGGKKLPLCKHIKYLGIYIDENLSWKHHQEQLYTKLKRAHNLLSIARHYVPKQSLLAIYHGSFSSHLSYGCQIWGQTLNNTSKLVTAQKKAMRIVNFSASQDHSNPIFKELNVLKIQDIIKLNNILLAHKVLNSNVPSNLLNFLSRSSSSHSHNTTFSNIGSVCLPTIKTNAGRNSIRYQCAKSWNAILKDLKNPNHNLLAISNIRNDKQWIQNLKAGSLKTMLSKYFLSFY